MNGAEKLRSMQTEPNFNYKMPEPDPTELQRNPESVEAKPRLDLVAKYSLFKEKLQPKADVVYHPCGANDISPSEVFPDSRVIYVDIDEKAIEALKESGVEAHVASALNFDPGNVDVLILLNPNISPDIPASHVIQGGFILSNDHQNTASHLYRNGGYELKAVIRDSRDQKIIYDTENLEDCWKEVDTEEEFKNTPFDWSSVNYETAASIVEQITGKRENVLAEYKKIVEMARERLRRQNAKTLAETPELANFLSDPDKTNELVFKHDQKIFILDANLPKKKSTGNDIFVFQKK